MKSADDLAKLCGVSPQAVREWCRKNDIPRGAKGKFLIDDEAETALLRHYKGDVGKSRSRVAQDSGYLGTVIEVLREQLREKDRQIEQLQTALGKALDQQQQLAAISEQRRIDAPVEQPAKKSFWDRLRKA